MSILFRFNIKKFLSGALGAVFFIANCALAHATETNFWASRRSASQRMRAGDNGLSAEGSPNGQILFAQMPQAGPLELGGGQGHSAHSPKSSDSVNVPFSVGPTTGDWLGKLVMPYGTVNDVYLSPKKDAPFIVHIQDAHGIEEAQRNISSMIGLLGQEPGINLVGVEGAWGSFSLEPYRDFPDPAMTKDVAEFLLKKGLIAGPEYAGLTMSKSPAFFGVENSDLYHANVKALKSAFKDKEAAVAWVDALQSHTEKLKVSDYSETLKTFDRHFSGYQSEKVKLADYVRYLTTTLTQIKPRPATPQLQLLMEALIQEGDLDFKRVEAERKQMVEKLVDKLSKAQIQDLVNKSVDYRAGRVGYAEYHAHLKQTCQDHGISMKAYPQMGRYIAYVLTADKIDRRALLNELDTVERTLPESLAKTPKEKELVALTYDLSLLNKLVRHEMSPADWTHYLARGKYIHTVPERVASLGGAPSPAFALTAFEDFCRFAAERNTALTGNLTQQMVNTKTNSSILIAGGFHTEGLSALLRQRQISYVVVTPKISAIPKDNNYLDVLARDPVPLEQLLAGDRIYLAKPLAMADAHSSAALLINAIENLLRNKKSIVPIDNKSSLTTDPGLNGTLLFTVQGQQIYFISSHPASHPFLEWLSSLASIVSQALPENKEMEGSFFIVRDIGNGKLEKEVKEIVGPKDSDERYQLSPEDREIAAALTVEYTDDIRESVAKRFNNRDLIPPFAVSGRIITTNKIQGKSFHEILKGDRDLLDADWLEKAREQCNSAINAANEALGLSHDGSGTLENGWRIQVDSNLENFLFDPAGRVIGWIDPIATWPPENKKINPKAELQNQNYLLEVNESRTVPKAFNSLQSIHERLSSIRNRSFWQKFAYGLTHPLYGGPLLETVGIFFGMKGVATAFSSANIHDPAWVLSALQSIGMVDPTGSVFLTSIFVAAVFSLIHPDLWRDLSQGWKRIRETAQRKTNSKGDVARIFFEVSKTFLGTFFQRFVGALVFISAIQLPSLSSFTTNTFTNFFVGMTLSYSIHSFANAAILSSSKPNGFIPIHFPRVANILKNIRLFSTTIDVNSFILLVLKQLKNENYIKHIHQELMATFPGYKNEFLREFEESQVNPSTIAAFWTIHSGLSIGEPTNNWKSLKSDLEATGKFEHIDDIPIGRGGFGEVRVCRSNNKEFLIKSVRFEKGTTLLNAIIAIASILIEGDILGKIKDHYRKGEVHHAAPLLIGKALFKGRNIIFQERILGKNGNAVEMGENALTKVERILHSLVELHKIGVVHGDIKPENIIITKEGEAVFIDFGASKLTGQGFLMSDVISTNMYGTTASDFLTGATKSSDVYQMALTLFAFLPTDILTRPDIFPYIKRTISGFPLPDDGVPPGLEKLMYRPSSEELHDAIATAIAHPMKPLSAIEQQGLFNEIRELRFSNSRRGNLVRSKNIKLGGNNFAFYFLRLFLSEQIAAKWSVRLLPMEISGLGWAGWFATGWAHTVLSGAVAFDPTLMGVLLMAGGILAFRGLHLGLDRLWYAKNPGQGPPSKDFWSNTARMMPYAMLPILTSSPVVFLVAFSVLAYDHFAFDLKRLFNINAPLANATKILVISMVSATFAVAIGPIIVSNLASPMGTFFLVSLAAQALDPGTLQSFSENPASGLIALGIGSVSNFLTYAFAMEWASMVLLGSVTSKLIYNTRQSPLFSFALAGGDSQRMDSSNSTIQTQADRPLNTISDNRGDYESYLISSPHSLLTKGRLERNLQIARQTVGVKSVFYLGAGTDLTHVLTSFPDATHVTLSGNNYGNITAESIKNEMTTTQIPSERTQQFLNTYKDSVLNDYKESVLNHGFAGTSLVQKSSMQSSFLALELLSLGVQTNSLREEHAGEISFEVPGLLGRPPRRVSFILKNNSFSRSPIQMNDGKREFDGFFAKAIDGIQPYYKEIFSALADRFSSSLTVVSDNAIPDNVGDIGFIKTSAFSLSDEDSGSYGNAFQVAKLSRSTLTGQDNNSAALAVISLIETRGLGKIADNLRPFVSAREYRQPFEFSEETTASDIGTAISILEEEDASIKAAEEYGRQWALAEGPNTRMVAVLFKIDSWAQETREIALAVVRGMLSAGKVIVVADERFDTTTIKTENQDKLEIIQVNEITDKFMERVKEIHSGPISKKVLVSEQHSRFLNDEYVAFIIEGLLRAIQNKIDALLAVLRAA